MAARRIHPRQVLVGARLHRKLACRDVLLDLKSTRPEFLPVCPHCHSTTFVRCEPWTRIPQCSNPPCVYARALARRVEPALQLVKGASL